MTKNTKIRCRSCGWRGHFRNLRVSLDIEKQRFEEYQCPRCATVLVVKDTWQGAVAKCHPQTSVCSVLK